MGARMLLRPDMTQLFWRCFQDCGLGRLPPLKGMVWFPFLTFAGTRFVMMKDSWANHGS